MIKINLLRISSFSDFHWEYFSKNFIKKMSFKWYIIIYIISIIIYLIISIILWKYNNLNSNHNYIKKELNNINLLEDIKTEDILSNYNIQNEELNEKEKEYKKNNNYLSIKGLTKKYNDIMLNM